VVATTCYDTISLYKSISAYLQVYDKSVFHRLKRIFLLRLVWTYTTERFVALSGVKYVIQFFLST
jgi:hypothetical protein